MTEEEIKALKIALEQFNGRERIQGDCLFLEGEVSKAALFFLETRNQCAEKILRDLLRNKDCHFKFLALYVFSKAQKSGVILQKETLEEFQKAKHRKNPETEMLLKCVERRLKIE